MTAFRYLLHIDSPEGARFELALRLLGEGTPIVYRRARIRATASVLDVEVISSYRAGQVSKVVWRD